jgi:hypothetical protein
MDGMDREHIVYATWTQDERDELVKADKGRAYQRPDKRIVEIEKARKAALKKLTALDRLVLGIDANGEPTKTKVYRGLNLKDEL